MKAKNPAQPARRKKNLGGVSPAERALVRGIAQGKSRRLAAEDAGYSASTAGSGYISQILSRPLVRSALTEALERAGVTFAKIVAPIADALQATKLSQTQDGLTETQIPDHRTRLEAHDRAVALYGGIPKIADATPTNQGLSVTIAVAGQAPAPRVVSAEPQPEEAAPASVAVQIRVDGTKQPGQP